MPNMGKAVTEAALLLPDLPAFETLLASTTVCCSHSGLLHRSDCGRDGSPEVHLGLSFGVR